MEIKYQLNQLEEISLKVTQNFNHKIILISGEMGSGKTTLIKQILISLNVIDNISSPTFSIINEYTTKSKDLVYHMDLYRINKIEELEEIGFFEYLESGNLCFIEWGDIIEDIIGEDYNKFKLTESDNLRIIEKIK
jgi:tRNA threonylcarbamoyladenosine biosynthesis protein TsaE